MSTAVVVCSCRSPAPAYSSHGSRDKTEPNAADHAMTSHNQREPEDALSFSVCRVTANKAGWGQQLLPTCTTPQISIAHLGCIDLDSCSATYKMKYHSLNSQLADTLGNRLAPIPTDLSRPAWLKTRCIRHWWERVRNIINRREESVNCKQAEQEWNKCRHEEIDTNPLPMGTNL